MSNDIKTITDYKPSKTGPIAYFHRFKDGAISLQGEITLLRKNYTGECQLFSWLTGEPTEKINVTRAFFDDCTFYDSDYDMRCAWENAQKRWHHE